MEIKWYVHEARSVEPETLDGPTQWFEVTAVAPSAGWSGAISRRCGNESLQVAMEEALIGLFEQVK